MMKAEQIAASQATRSARRQLRASVPNAMATAFATMKVFEMRVLAPANTKVLSTDRRILFSKANRSSFSWRPSPCRAEAALSPRLPGRDNNLHPATRAGEDRQPKAVQLYDRGNQT